MLANVRLFPVALFLLLAWGALAVGGSPAWSGMPVAVFAVATGILGFIEGPQHDRVPHRSVILAAGLLFAAIGAQLIPFPPGLVETLSPERDAVNYERLLATADSRDPELVPNLAADEARPLSVAPSRTWLGVGMLASFAFFMFGASRGISSMSLTRFTRALIVLGVFVAFLGMYQSTVTTDGLYAIYAPLTRVHRSAPFINRNHQSGWLVMVIALALGAFLGELARGLSTGKAGWRERIVWFGSKEATVAILLLVAAAIMAVGVLASRSRSGASIMLFSFVAFAILSRTWQSTRTARRMVALSILAVALIVIATSSSGVAERISESSVMEDARMEIWSESSRIVPDFWLTGTGFNTYGAAFLNYHPLLHGVHYIEAHNDYLQIATEGGVLLGIPLLIVIWTLIREVRRRFAERADDTRTHWLRVGAVIGMCAIAIQSIGEFTLQMPGAAVMFATLLAIAIHKPSPSAAATLRK